MKSIFILGAVLVLLVGSILAQVPAAEAKPDPLRVQVDELEEAFLQDVVTTAEPEKVFEEYEAAMKKLIAQHPGRPEPFTGLMELFEKCGAARTRRVLDECLARQDLPEKIRPAYERTRRTLNLLGTPVGLHLTALDGSPIRFDELRGKVVVIDFWATWCGPCVRDLPKLQALLTKHQQDGLMVVGVSFDRERAKLDAFLQTNALPWRQVFVDAALKETLAREFGVTGGYLPMAFIIGRDGQLRHTLDTRFRMEEKVAALLKQ
jgi:peroxiredoxin